MEETTSWQVTTIGQGERLIRRSPETVQPRTMRDIIAATMSTGVMYRQPG